MKNNFLLCTLFPLAGLLTACSGGSSDVPDGLDTDQALIQGSDRDVTDANPSPAAENELVPDATPSSAPEDNPVPDATPSSAPEDNPVPDATPSSVPEGNPVPDATPSSVPEEYPVSDETVRDETLYPTSVITSSPVVAGLQPLLDLSTLTPERGLLLTTSGGFTTTALGDVNGDGRGDLLMNSVVLERNTADNLLGSLLVFGSATPQGIDQPIIESPPANTLFFEEPQAIQTRPPALPVAGDINGDGLTDMALGAPNSTANSSETAGKIYVVFGAANLPTNFSLLSQLDGTNGFVINGFIPGQQIGNHFSWIGDVNADGYDDLALVSEMDPVNAFSEQVYIIHGKAGGFPAQVELSQIAQHGQVLSVGNLGSDLCLGNITLSGSVDVNNDGASDMALTGQFRTCPLADTEFTQQSVFTTFLGSPGIGINATSISRNIAQSDGFQLVGVTQAYSIGDINGDSMDEFVLNTSTDTQNYILLSAADPLVGTIELEELSLERLKSISPSVGSVFPLGDLLFDGLDDLLYDAAFQGTPRDPSLEVYAIYDGLEDIRYGNNYSLENEVASTRIIWSEDGTPDEKRLVSALPIGDYNGDGFPDSLIGLGSSDSGYNPVIVIYGSTP